jgi:hypothetical protein
MRKIGLIMMALVLALGTLGVGYAMWSDTVTIDGTVNTGSVDIVIEDVSETWVYKNLTTREMECYPNQVVDANLMYVASATTSAVGGAEPVNESVTMTFDNIFPTDMAVCPIVADVLFHYVGSVPVHIWYDETFSGDDLSPYLIQEWLLSTDGGTSWVAVDPDTEILQLHECYLLKLNVMLDGAALQAAGNAAQGLTGGFTKTIVAHQWNEAYP